MIPALLLAVAARLGFLVIGRDPSGAEVGIFADGAARQHLVISSGGRDGTWTLLDALPPGFGPVLFTRSTYEVLHGGTLNEDGSIAYEGRSYRLVSWFDGASWTASAVAMQTTA